MLSDIHEHLVALFRYAPELAPLLLKMAGNIELPEGKAIEGDSALGGAVPQSAYADKVICIVRKDGKNVAAIVVEVQLKVDPEKQWTLPLYVASARARLRCPTYLLVVIFDDLVARWYRKTIEMGHPGFDLSPLVVDRSVIEVDTTPQTPENPAEYSVLKAVIYGRTTHAVDTAKEAFEKITGLEEGRQQQYIDAVMAALSKVALKQLEEDMRAEEFKSDFARKYIQIGVEQGIEQGIGKGIERGIEKTTERYRNIVISAAEARFGSLSEEIRQALAETSAEDLEGILAKLIMAEGTEEAAQVLQSLVPKAH